MDVLAVWLGLTEIWARVFYLLAAVSVYNFFRPLLFSLGAETAHNVGMRTARLAQATGFPFMEGMFAWDDDRLAQTVLGMDFPSPIGLAAGFDKNGKLVRFWERLGFGFVEVGSVSAKSSKGNKRPRAFRLEADEALINRMGLNNQGAARIGRRLGKVAPQLGIPMGINLAKTHSPTIMGDAAIEDFRTSFRALASHASYVALNISCPNTTEGKTFEDPEAFESLLKVIFAERATMGLDVPILVKLSPPLTDKVVFDSLVEDVLALAVQYGVAGLIATNTASDRKGLQTTSERLDTIGRGGLSGKPLEQRATRLVRYLYQKTEGQIPIIGVGGVHSAESAYAKIRAGASLVQLYTALVYEGPGLIRQIKEGLVTCLERDGFGHISEAIGQDA